MPQNAAPQPGSTCLQFDGVTSYAEIPSIAAYSVANTGELTVSAWMRPDVLQFPHAEGTNYVHWMGKGNSYGATGDQEWAHRMYSFTTTDIPPRPNRTSFYVFNLEGGLGVGSHVQEPVQVGEWRHIVGVADEKCTYLYRNGVLIKSDTYRGRAQGTSEIHFNDPPCQNIQLVITPESGLAPLRLGTMNFKSYFQGGLTRVLIWGRALLAAEIAGLYATDTAPPDGLVAEFLLDADTGTSAIDTALGNSGNINSATWAVA